MIHKIASSFQEYPKIPGEIRRYIRRMFDFKTVALLYYLAQNLNEDGPEKMTMWYSARFVGNFMFVDIVINQINL